ncbi:hypothetical protein NPIL_446711 [Nephila pilipes]|uniref:Uncharacterized protein n=1 Tax=Nephila pilipes TaxID=299642 RepID=A0A8X6MP33_NEPPI|nr:hypothetical protein NPIL_446711 [Nephila pilipes]
MIIYFQHCRWFKSRIGTSTKIPSAGAFLVMMDLKPGFSKNRDPKDLMAQVPPLARVNSTDLSYVLFGSQVVSGLRPMIKEKKVFHPVCLCTVSNMLG